MNKNSLGRWVKLMEFGNKLGCHQMPERSFFINSWQFPICARCTGVVIGEIFAIILLIFRCNIPILYLLLLLIPMGIDWGLQYIKICISSNIRRLITGILGGLSLTIIYYNIFLYTYEIIRELIL